MLKPKSLDQCTPDCTVDCGHCKGNKIGRIVRVKSFAFHVLHNTTGTIVGKGRGVNREYLLVRLSDEKELFGKRGADLIEILCLLEEVEFIR